MKSIPIAILVCALASSARAQAPAVAAAPASTVTPTSTVTRTAPPPPKGRFLTYASFGMNAYTYLGSTAAKPSTQYTPADRAVLFQQLGIGYFFHPNLRVMLTFLFGETVSGLPAGTGPYTVFAIIPWLVYTTHGFFTGIGPQLAPVSYGKAQNFDAGIYTATGYSVALGRGFSLPLSLQAVLMLNQRVSFALTPAVALAYRF